jgi:hypothetical protein
LYINFLQNITIPRPFPDASRPNQKPQCLARIGRGIWLCRFSGGESVKTGEKPVFSAKTETFEGKKPAIPAKNQAIPRQKPAIPAKKEAIPGKKTFFKGFSKVNPQKGPNRRPKRPEQETKKAPQGRLFGKLAMQGKS